MAKSIVMGLSLFGLWLMLSGYFDPLLLSLGVASCALTVAVAWRMRLIDEESVPLQLPLLRLLAYWSWLGREITRANIAVARLILSPKMPINQHLLYVPTSQKTDMGRVVYANSITLTPGTITVETEPGRFLVHALTDAAADMDALADMDGRVTGTEVR